MAARDLRLLPQYRCAVCGSMVLSYYPPKWDRPYGEPGRQRTADSPPQDGPGRLVCAKCWKR